MIRFEYPFVYLLLLLFPLLYFFLYRRYKRTEHALLCLYTRRYLEKTLFYKVGFLKLLVSMCISVFFVFGFSQPILSIKSDEDETSKKNIVIGIDMSKSMYVEEGGDIRMKKLIDYITPFISSNVGSRFMIVGFTDKIIQLTPFTDDTLFLMDVLEQIRKHPIAHGSTDYANVVLRLVELIKQEKNTRGIENIQFIFASDGESHTVVQKNILGDIARMVDSVAVISVGKEEAVVVLDDGAYIIDGQGMIATTTARPVVLEKMAKSVGAIFVNIEKKYIPALTTSPLFKGVFTEEQNIAWIGWFGITIFMFIYIIIVLL